MRMPATGTTVFANARILDPSRGLDERGTVIVKDGRIAAVGVGASNQGVPDGAELIDCGGRAIMPGLVDGRVFIGEPGAEHRETIASASAAAELPGSRIRLAPAVSRMLSWPCLSGVRVCRTMIFSARPRRLRSSWT